MKNPSSKRFNINQNSVLYFNLGLVISLLAVILAFEYRTPYDEDIMCRMPVVDVIEVVDIPITTHEAKPPPPPVKKPPILTPVEEEYGETEKVDIQHVKETIIPDDTNFKLITEDIPDEVPDEPIIIAEVMPAYAGGLKAFYSYVQKSLRYPKQAKRMGIEGRVIIEFVISEDGQISSAKVLQGIGAGCDEEALRVILAAPDWRPGKQRGKPVKVRMALPITFKLH